MLPITIAETGGTLFTRHTVHHFNNNIRFENITKKIQVECIHKPYSIYIFVKWRSSRLKFDNFNQK